MPISSGGRWKGDVFKQNIKHQLIDIPNIPAYGSPISTTIPNSVFCSRRFDPFLYIYEPVLPFPERRVEKGYQPVNMKLYTPKAAVAVALLLNTSLSCVEAKLDESLKGCYKGPGSLKDMGPTKYQSTGACRELCKKSQSAVFALHDTNRCSCGDKYPPEDLKASPSDKTCILVGCPGFDKDECLSILRLHIFFFFTFFLLRTMTKLMAF